jgi:hypothetical protein
LSPADSSTDTQWAGFLAAQRAAGLSLNCRKESGEVLGIIIVCLLALLILLFFHLLLKERRKQFEAKFTPISDEEFMALCKPGTDPKIALKVRRIVAENLGVEYDRIYPSARFLEDLGAE